MATLTLTTSVSITTDDGTVEGLSSTSTISSVTEVLGGTVDAALGAETALFGAGSAGQGSLADIDLIIIINRTTSDFVRLRFNDDGGDTCDVKLPAGRPFMLHSRDFDVNTTEAAFAAFTQIDEIKVQPDTTAGVIEFKAYST